MLTNTKTAVIVIADGFDATARCQPVLNATQNDLRAQAMDLISAGPIPRQEGIRLSRLQ